MFIFLISTFFNSVIHFMMYVSDSIFSGINVAVPVFYLFSFLIRKSVPVRLVQLSLTTNILLLAGAFVFLAALISNTIYTWQSGNTEGIQFMLSALTGVHWYQFVIPVFNFGILPNVLWFKKAQRSLYSSGLILLVWIISYYLMLDFSSQSRINKLFAYGFFGFSLNEFVQKLGIFVILFSVLFFVIKTKKGDWENQLQWFN